MTTWIVCGGRDYTNKAELDRVCLEVVATHGWPKKVVHGGARGADTLAAAWFGSRGIPTKSYPADWAMYGLSAGPVRNSQMLLDMKVSLVVAFPGGSGTADMVAKARAAGVEVVLAGGIDSW
jgi:hypothetical protein